MKCKPPEEARRAKSIAGERREIGAGQRCPSTAFIGRGDAAIASTGMAILLSDIAFLVSLASLRSNALWLSRLGLFTFLTHSHMGTVYCDSITTFCVTRSSISGHL